MAEICKSVQKIMQFECSLRNTLCEQAILNYGSSGVRDTTVKNKQQKNKKHDMIEKNYELIYVTLFKIT